MVGWLSAGALQLDLIPLTSLSITDICGWIPAQVRELMLLVQHQANTIEALQLELVRHAGSSTAKDAKSAANSRHFGAREDSVEAAALARMQEMLLANMQLSSLNAELVEKMDRMGLQCSLVRKCLGCFY